MTWGSNNRSTGLSEMKTKDIAGQRFGRLVAKRFAGRQGSLALWLCVCDCGEESVRQLGKLTSGLATMCSSCGRSHRNTRHGLRFHPLYNRWSNIRSRCEDPNNKDYKNYGGRGIRLDIRWTDPATFIRDMEAKGYFPGATVERRDNDGPYSNDNCVWATTQQQARNKRTNTAHGEE